MTTSLTLPSELTIYSLGQLKTQWLAAIPKASRAKRSGPGQSAAWPVDSSAVNEVDAAGIQLLLALSATLRAKRRTLHLVNPSRPLVAACQSLGLAALLGAPGDAA